MDLGISAVRSATITRDLPRRVALEALTHTDENKSARYQLSITLETLPSFEAVDLLEL